MKKISLILMAFAFVCHGLMGQNNMPTFQSSSKDLYNVPTPNQSNLGTYGIIPVSPYTGKADVSIPIYSTTQRDVPLNINLTYDTSGLLINQLPGWTGHNWTLNAGGAITRKINGRPDEIDYKGTGAGKEYYLWDAGSFERDVLEELYKNENEYTNDRCWDYCRKLEEQISGNYFDDVFVYGDYHYGYYLLGQYGYYTEHGYYLKDSYGDEWIISSVEGYRDGCQNFIPTVYHISTNYRPGYVYAMKDQARYSFGITYYPYDASGYKISDEARTYFNNILDNKRYNESKTVERLENFKNYFKYSKNIPENSTNNKNLSFGIKGKDFDDSADMFYFNFMGISGQFFYGNDGQWKVRSDRNICVKFDVDDENNYIEPLEEYIINVESPYTGAKFQVKQPKTIKGFTLIDEMGNQYLFGGNRDLIEYSTPLTAILTNGENSTEPWSAVSWMLKEVKDRFGKILYSFNYSRGKNVVQIQNQNNRVSGEYFTMPKMYNATVSSPVYLDSINICNGINIKFKHSHVFNARTIEKLYPNLNNDLLEAMMNEAYPMRKATANNHDAIIPGQTEFYDAFAECYKRVHAINFYSLLSEMKNLKDTDLEQLNSIHIVAPGALSQDNYYYFKYDINTRMHMTSVSHICKNSSGSSYNFEYDGFDKIPRDYLTKEFDYWGYYNGDNFEMVSEPLLPFHKKKSEKYPNQLYKNRPNITYGKLGMLKSITYPTGGHTTFEYEQNTCNKYVKLNRDDVENLNSEMLVGGLRIKRISNYIDRYDEQNVSSQKTYEYNKSGVLYSEPCSYFNLLQDGQKGNFEIVVANSIVPLANTFSPTVGYSSVIEKELDGSYKEYSFTNYDDVNCKDDEYVNAVFKDSLENAYDIPYNEYSSRQFMCGKLLSEKQYDKNKNNVASTEYTYDLDNAFNANNTGFNDKNFVLTADIFYNRYLCHDVGTVHKLYYYNPKVKSVVSKVKNGGSWVMTETTNEWKDFNFNITDNGKKYNVNAWKNLKETVSRGSNVLKTIYTYPFTSAEHNLSENETFNLTPNYVNEKINTKIQQQYFIPSIGTQQFLDGKFLNGALTEYAIIDSQPVPKYDIEYVGDRKYERYDTLATYVSYSPTFRPTDIIDESNVHHYLYWNKKDQLEGVIDLTTRLGINKSATENLIKNGKSIAEAIKTANPEYVYTSMPYGTTLYEYDAMGNVSKITKGNNQTTNYEYDKFGRLAIIKDYQDNVVKKMDYHYPSYQGQDFDDIISDLGNFVFEPSRNGTSKTELKIQYKLPYGTDHAIIEIRPVGVNAEPIVTKELPTDKREGEVIIDMKKELIINYWIKLCIDDNKYRERCLVFDSIYK